MILYLADRRFNIIGNVNDSKGESFVVENDERILDISTSVETFSFDVYYKPSSRTDVEKIFTVGNYILRPIEKENEYKCYTIIDSDQNTNDMSIHIYSEDAGLDLINDICSPFNEEEADLNLSVNLATDFSPLYDGYINATGEFISNSNFRSTDYLSIESDIDAFLLSAQKSASGGKRFGAAFYDSSKKYVGGPGAYLYVYDSSQVSRVDIPDKAVYIRVSFHVDFDDVRIAESTVHNYTIGEYALNCISNSGFEIGLNALENRLLAIEFSEPQTAKERLLDIMSNFGAEMSFRYEFDGFKIRHKYLNIYQRRGSSNSIDLRFGREVKNIRINKSVADIATAIKAFGVKTDSDNNTIYFTLKNYSGEVEEGYYVSDDLLCSEKAYNKWSRYISDGKKNAHIIKEFEYECQEVNTLYKNALAYLKSVEDLDVNYEIELDHIPSGIGIGDYVQIIDEVGDLYFSSRVLTITSSELNGTSSITLGEFSPEGISGNSSSGGYSGGGSGGSSSVTDYNSLNNKPSINSITLVGNKTGTQLSLVNSDDSISESDIDTIVYGGLG